jgi:hypothetical protein
MKYNNLLSKTLILFSIIFIYVSCEKESIEEIDYKRAMKMVEFTCTDTLTTMFFHGYLNNKELCYNSGVEGYEAQAAIVSGYQTYAPTINFNDPSTYVPIGSWFQFGFVQKEMANFKDELVIEAPVDSFGTSFIELVETHLKQDTLKIRDEKSNAEIGFNIKITIPYSPMDNNGFLLYEKITATGSQDGSKFIIIKLEKSETAFYTNFDIIAELNCKLYNPINVNGNGEFFGEITDGTLEIRISVPK